MIIIPGTFVFDGNKNEYIVEEFIGNGAFGNVYKIKRISDDTIFALKTIASNFPDESSLFSFRNEIEMATKIKNPYVIEYIYAHDGIAYPELPPYIIMEYANQGTLKNLIDNLIKKNEFLSNEKLKRLYSQLIIGMKAVNSVLVHRDIKPDNILFSNSNIKISDFGLSKVSSDKTRNQTFKGFGHLRYTAPEGWKDEKNTIQMDIYSMGLVFYELATLKYPYDVQNHSKVDEWANAHMFTEPLNPCKINANLSPVIAGVIMKMLEKSTSQRFKNWEEIEQYLENDNGINEGFSDIIDNMLKISLAKANSKSEEELEHKRKIKEQEDFCKLINYKFEKDIFKPISQFIMTFNEKYPQGKISISFRQSNIKENNINIKLISGTTINIILNAIIDFDFIRKVTHKNPFGEIYTKVETQVPYINKRKIMAWGGLYVDNKTGFNILLLEKENELYGEWLLLENTNSGLSRTRRPEPFAFELNEIEKEIQYVNSLHIYNTSMQPFDLNKFYECIAKNI